MEGKTKIIMIISSTTTTWIYRPGMEGKTTFQKEEAWALTLQSLYLLQQFSFGDFFPSQSGWTHFMSEEIISVKIRILIKINQLTN